MKKLEIYIDHFYENPFTNWDCMPTLFAADRNYHWEGHEMAQGGYESLEQEFSSKFPNVIAVPIYLYSHGGDTVSTKPFSCPWDSGQLGYLFFTRQQVREDYGVKRISPELKEKVIACLKEDVKLLDTVVKGEVYGFKVLDKHGEEEDSCWGFYGEDVEGIAQYLNLDDFDSPLEEVVEEAFENVHY